MRLHILVANYVAAFISWIGHNSGSFALNKSKRIQGSNSANVKFQALGKDFKIGNTNSEVQDHLVKKFL